MGQARPGEIYSFRILGGGYGAAQVIAAKPDGSDPWVQLLRLDVDGALPPEPSEVAVSAAESAIADGDECLWDCLWVSAFVPWWAQRIGEAPVRPRASSQVAQLNDLPPKPKGMHWNTYDSLVERYQAYSDKWNLEILRRFGRHFR
jgi:hypothetical protein